jgi:hypothetical protein
MCRNDVQRDITVVVNICTLIRIITVTMVRFLRGGIHLGLHESGVEGRIGGTKIAKTGESFGRRE